MIDHATLAPALIGVVAGCVAAIALYQVAWLRKALFALAAVAVAFAYLHGGVDELTADAVTILQHLGRERAFWLGVLAGKLLAALVTIPARRLSR